MSAYSCYSCSGASCYSCSGAASMPSMSSAAAGCTDVGGRVHGGERRRRNRSLIGVTSCTTIQALCCCFVLASNEAACSLGKILSDVLQSFMHHRTEQLRMQC